MPARLPALACAGLGVLALLAAMASLWPGLSLPAWPAGTLAIAALSLAALPGGVVPKALGTLTGACALLLMSAEVGALWAMALTVP